MSAVGRLEYSVCGLCRVATVVYSTHRHTMLYFTMASVFATLASMYSHLSQFILVCTSWCCHVTVNIAEYLLFLSISVCLMLPVPFCI